MEMVSVSSSRISKVGWEKNKLYIVFKDGAMYEYDNVYPEEYQAFMNSPSLGSEISRLDKIHPYRRI